MKFENLSSKNIVLRKLDLSDSKCIYNIRSNKQISEHLDRPLESSLNQAEDFIIKINQGIENNKLFYWGITKTENNRIIGTICLWNISIDKLEADIGFELLPEYQSKGIMSEAVRLVLDFAFNKAGFKKIEGEVAPNNLRSIKLMKKFGFNLQSTKPHSESPNTIIYELNNYTRQID